MDRQKLLLKSIVCRTRKMMFNVAKQHKTISNKSKFCFEEYRFKFCEIPLGLRFVLRYPGHAVDAGNDLPESISSEAVETFLPRSAWREGCYLFRRIPIEGEADLQAYGESVIRFVYFAKQWHYDFPYYWPEDWVTHIDQGCKYWNSVKFLGSSAVASDVWREYEYWQEYRDLADVRRSVKPAKRRILSKNAK